MRFVDTNILLYAVSKAPDESPKNRIALKLLEADDLVLSVQVLQEFYVQATRPDKRDRLTHEQAGNLIESWLRFRVQDTTVAILRSALATAARWRVSSWDAAIIEAARTSGCHTLLSEDLQNGQDFGGVRVQNPFAQRSRE